jgi:hypothetical protein
MSKEEKLGRCGAYLSLGSKLGRYIAGNMTRCSRKAVTVVHGTELCQFHANRERNRQFKFRVASCS